VTHRSRRVDVDALRIAAVVVVLVVHAAMVYSPWQTWHVQNDVRSRGLAELTLFAGPWLMSLFMLLAGRSAFYSLEHRTDRQYLSERFARLFIPLLAGTLLLIPPMMYVRRTLEGRFQGGVLSFYPHFFDGFYPDGNLSWGHLWFLAYLLVYGFLLLPVMRRITAWYAGGGRIHRPILFVVGVTAIGVASQLALRAPYPQTNALVSDWANHAQLVLAFLFGYVLANDAQLEEALDRQRHRALAVAILASTVLGMLAWPGLLGDRGPEEWSQTYAMFWTAEAVATWAWLFAITAYARRWIREESRWLVSARDGVYPFYVLHQPVLVLVGWFLVPRSLPVFPEFLLLLGAAFGATIGICALAGLSRPTRVLLGMRSPALP
jgi:glucan biosynthesis protein C